MNRAPANSPVTDQTCARQGLDGPFQLVASITAGDIRLGLDLRGVHRAIGSHGAVYLDESPNGDRTELGLDTSGCRDVDCAPTDSPVTHSEP